MPSPSDIPPAYRALYDAAGPVVRYRLVRDVLGRDESYRHTARLAFDVARRPETHALVSAQQPDGSWNGRLATEIAVLRLCELGLETHDAVKRCLEQSLLPTLLDERALGEFAALVSTDGERILARRVVRDQALRLITRATRTLDDVLKPTLELLLTEWELFLSSPRERETLPTADAWAAVCSFPWSDAEFPRVRTLAERLFARAETRIGRPLNAPPWFAPHAFQFADKWEYLARPPLFFHELELAARLGAARELPITRWLLEELEMRQDGDGWYRFESAEAIEKSWYYPLDTDGTSDPAVEWTFRAALIYKLLEYDL